MAKQRTKPEHAFVFILLLFICSAPILAQKNLGQKAPAHSNGLRAVIWRNPGDVAALNLFYGAGGKEHAPDPSAVYTFVSEDTTGTQPKFDVRDDQGVKWKVKLGHESQSEVAATRLLWAAGYFVDEDYYLPELKVTGLPKLRRGQGFVSPGGVVRGARLKRHIEGHKKLGTWDWSRNPFTGTRELNGLKVMMALMNNWDLLTRNNEVYETANARFFEVKDLGATFGKGGNNFTWSKSVLRDYENSNFIDNGTPREVDFKTRSHVFATPVLRFGKQNKTESVTRDIPRADAKWLGQSLAHLSADQIRDCFRAAGYTPEEVEGYTTVVQKRIAELNAL
ncbi:MAG TPA: hypothetical protein VGQ11_10930 [Candidatus Acidoferrales bacterium]|nr:hypothetical protein [Candidatus Acidoferrales bacterium]